ncbi:hypothetical protein BGZ94_002319 [Podila epigama]|nr:hypothetical protein BGZ94_002319 [Podila epigama]
MPIPLSSNHPHFIDFSPLPNATSGSGPPSLGATGSATTTATTHGRVHGHDNHVSTRRYNRLQRRSPIESTIHYSPRTRYYSSFAPTNHPNHRTTGLHLVQRRGPEATILQQHHHENFVVSRHGFQRPSHQQGAHLSQSQQQPSQQHSHQGSHQPSQHPSQHPSQQQHSRPQSQSQSQSQSQLLNALAMESSHPSDALLLRPHSELLSGQRASRQLSSQAQAQTHAHPPVRTHSSSPTTRYTYTYDGQTSHHVRHHDDAYPQRRSQQTMASTPMERSLTNNPSLPSHNTAGHLSSSSSTSTTTTSSFSLPPSPPSSSSSSSAIFHQSNIRDANDIVQNTENNNHNNNNRNIEHFPSPVDAELTGTPLEPRDPHPGHHHNRHQVDDRIHFRLFDDVYFPTPSSSINSFIAEDADMDSDQDEQQYAHAQAPRDTYNDDTESIDFEHETLRHSLPSRDHSIFATRHIHQGNDTDSDSDGDSDDGIEQILESRRQSQPETFSFVPESPSTPSPSLLERPQHAQLSPRSAAALTTLYSMGRSSWPQPLPNSSISSRLLAMASQPQQSAYDNNPHYRRPLPLGDSTEIHIEAHSSLQPMQQPQQQHERQQRQRTDSLEDEVSSFRRPTAETLLQSVRPDIDSSLTQRRPRADYRGCGEIYSMANTEARGDDWPLNFELYYADGGEFNAAHSVDNVLKNDSSVYCSRRSTNINICLKLAEPNQSFVLTQFKAKAPTTGFTAPCKEGLIFVSHQPISLETTSYFDNMTRQGYDEYMKIIKEGPRFDQMLAQHGPAADAMVPAAFFQMNGPDDSCTLDFTPNRSGRYVLIKLLRSRCTNSLQRPENIDLQYLGLIGKHVLACILTLVSKQMKDTLNDDA